MLKITGKIKFRIMKITEKNRSKRTAILYENCPTEISVCWTCGGRVKRVGNYRRKIKSKSEGQNRGEYDLMMSRNGRAERL